MRKFLTYSASCLALSIFAHGIFAQNFEFVADYLRYDDKRQWVSLEGAIELKTDYGYFYPSKIEYDISNERVYVDGEMRGILPSGERIIAQYSELDFKAQSAVLNAVRTLLQNGMQATSKQFQDNDNVTYAENVIASTCTVCALDPTPIWQVRAQQVYWDKTVQKVYVRNGYFDFFGVPVGWTPYLRFPAPDAVRMDGFLPVSFTATTADTRGMTLSYYLPFSDYTDATASVQLGAKSLQLIGGQFRHNGQGYNYQADGTYVRSGSPANDGRYQIIQKLAYRLPEGWGGQARYLIGSDYDVDNEFDFPQPNSDYVYLEKYTNDFWAHIEILKYLPPTENAAAKREYPLVLPHAEYQYTRALQGGAQFNTNLDFLYLDQSMGEDVTRFSSDAALKLTNMFPFGILATSEFGAQGGIYNIQNATSATDDGNAARITPFTSLDLQMPFISSTERADYILTPRMMVAWSDNFDSGVTIPNTDSLFVEHDFVSLFTDNHFTGLDQFETGSRGSLGLSYTMITPENQNFEMGLGRIWGNAELTGNDGVAYPILGDWVGYLVYSLNDEWSTYSRFAVDNEFNFSRSEIEFNYDSDYSSYSLDWVRLAPEPEIGFDTVRSEVLLDGKHQFAPNWEVKYNLRYDVANLEPFDAGLSLAYGNECIEITTGASWDFAPETGSGVQTSYKLNVEFFGLSGDRKKKWATQTCNYNITN